MYYSLYNWIGEHETKEKRLLRIQKKGRKNKDNKKGSKWNDTKWTI